MGPDNVVCFTMFQSWSIGQLLWCRRRYLGPEVQRSGPKHPLESGRNVCVDVSMMITFICKLAVL
jgi:hypothetical protein